MGFQQLVKKHQLLENLKRKQAFIAHLHKQIKWPTKKEENMGTGKLYK